MMWSAADEGRYRATIARRERALAAMQVTEAQLRLALAAGVVFALCIHKGV